MSLCAKKDAPALYAGSHCSSITSMRRPSLTYCCSFSLKLNDYCIGNTCSLIMHLYMAKCRLQFFYPFSLHLQSNFKGKSTSTRNGENLQSTTENVYYIQFALFSRSITFYTFVKTISFDFHWRRMLER